MSGNYINHNIIQGIDDDKGEIALCILSAINVGQLNNPRQFRKNLCDLAVRSLDEIIDYSKIIQLRRQK